jgi:hypothetical protein
MGVIELSVRTLPTERRDAFLALEVFRPNVLIPAPIVALAFEAYTGKSYDPVLLRHMLLAAVDARVLVHDESRDCYKVLDLVAECLERTTIYPAHIGQGQRPSSTMLSARGKASSEAPWTSLERRELLAAFLISFGKPHVAAKACEFLGVSPAMVGPELCYNNGSSMALAADMLKPGGLQASRVLAYVLSCRAAAAQDYSSAGLRDALIDGERQMDDGAPILRYKEPVQHSSKVAELAATLPFELQELDQDVQAAIESDDIFALPNLMAQKREGAMQNLDQAVQLAPEHPMVLLDHATSLLSLASAGWVQEFCGAVVTIKCDGCEGEAASQMLQAAAAVRKARCQQAMQELCEVRELLREDSFVQRFVGRKLAEASELMEDEINFKL